MSVRKSVMLSDIADLELGKAPCASSIVPPGAGTPHVARPSELGRRYPTVETATTRPLRMARTGDLIMSVRGANLGRVNIADKDYALGRGLAAIRPRLRDDTEFLFFGLTEARTQLNALVAGTTVPSINIDQLAYQPIPWPPVRERRTIGAALRTIDEFGQRTGSYAHLVSDAAEAIYASSVRSGGAEPLPHGWAQTALGELAEEVRDRIQPIDLAARRVVHYSYEAHRAYGLPEVTPGDQLGSTKKRVPDGALLLSLLEPSRWVAWRALDRHEQLAVCSPEFLVVVPRDPQSAALVYAALRFDEGFQQQIRAAAQGAAPGRERTKPNDALRAEVPLPPAQVSYQLAARFESVFELETTSRRHARTADRLLSPAVQSLISGVAA